MCGWDKCEHDPGPVGGMGSLGARDCAYGLSQLFSYSGSLLRLQGAGTWGAQWEHILRRREGQRRGSAKGA